jgi:hypothetical protein
MRASSWLVTMGAILAVAVGPAAGAQTAGTTHTNSQQEKMKTCNTDATTKGLKGDERQTYMKTCLSKEGSTAKKGNSQQEKMKTCNADATTKGLKGTERQTFMKSCLSAGG